MDKRAIMLVVSGSMLTTSPCHWKYPPQKNKVDHQIGMSQKLKARQCLQGPVGVPC